MSKIGLRLMIKKNFVLIFALLLLVACGAKDVPQRDAEAERLHRINMVDTTTIRAKIVPDSIEGHELLEGITAEAWVLLEDSTGYVISEKNASERMYMASLTKMMTGLLALEHGHGDDSLYVTEDDYVARDSRVKLGQGYQMRDLIVEMMMASDNDAAYTLARHIAGDTIAFCAMMNERAAYLGMNGTHYATPNGLPNDSNYTTAYDQLLLARYCMADTTFVQIVSTKEAKIPLLDGRHLDILNTNQLLFTYDGCIGIKTGFTYQAGACLAAAATRDGVTLYVVLLKSRNMKLRFKEAAILLDYGFQVMKKI